MRRTRGALVAEALRGSWRAAPEPAHLSEDELGGIAPLLLASGSSALAWRRLRHGPLASTAAADEIHQAYRLHALQAELHQRALDRLLARLDGSGHDVFLGKGWAAARVYLEPGLRPYGDFDLYVAEEHWEAIRRCLEGVEEAGASVDLHRGFGPLADRSVATLRERSVLIDRSPVALRLFGAEDHLRLLCLHLLGHGAWRPLWLCDVAAAVETRSAAFDWDYLLSGDRRKTEWVGATVVLTGELLGVSMSDVPMTVRAASLPAWLPRAVLREWGRPQVPHGTRIPMATVLRRPGGILPALRQRWPNPVEATVDLGGRFTRFPRLPIQLAECVVRVGRFARRAVFRTHGAA